MHIQFSTRPTQDNANHIHTVWRGLKNDWGEIFCGITMQSPIEPMNYDMK